MANYKGTSSGIDLADACVSYYTFPDSVEDFLRVFIKAGSATDAVLELQSLTCVKDGLKLEQLEYSDELKEEIQKFLRKWRCTSRPEDMGYTDQVEKFLRDRTIIFRTFKVPLFIDNYGDKRLMAEFVSHSPLIEIEMTTPIIHVTHTEEMEKIFPGGGFKPSGNKNAMEGVWFGIKKKHESRNATGGLRSRYGSWAFETTLEDLGIRGLHQGEIVSYKNEVNFILYASNRPTTTTGLKRATDDAIKSAMRNRKKAFAAVSIFVPWDFMTEKGKNTLNSLEPKRISHGDICVKAKRNGYICDELE